MMEKGSTNMTIWLRNFAAVVVIGAVRLQVPNPTVSFEEYLNRAPRDTNTNDIDTKIGRATHISQTASFNHVGTYLSRQ